MWNGVCPQFLRVHPVVLVYSRVSPLSTVASWSPLGDCVRPKLPVLKYRSRGIVSVPVSCSIVDSGLLESPGRHCSIYGTCVEVQKRQILAPT